MEDHTALGRYLAAVHGDPDHDGVNVLLTNIALDEASGRSVNG